MTRPHILLPARDVSDSAIAAAVLMAFRAQLMTQALRCLQTQQPAESQFSRIWDHGVMHYAWARPAPVSTEPENCVGGRVGGVRLYPRPYILVATGRKMRCLIVQSIGWEIGRRRGKAILANMTQSSLHLENGTGDCLRDGLWSKKCVCVCVCARVPACVRACSCVCVHARACTHSFAQSYLTLWLHGLQPTKLLCPRNFSGKSTGTGCHFLCQGIFPTQGWNLCLLHLLYWWVVFSPLRLGIGSNHSSFLAGSVLKNKDSSSLFP